MDGRNEEIPPSRQPHGLIMLQGQALEIVLKMARELHMGRGQREDVEMEAIEEVEQLLTQFEDTGNYTEEDYMD